MDHNHVHIPPILDEQGNKIKEATDLNLEPVFNLFELSLRDRDSEIESVFRKHKIPYSFDRLLHGKSYYFIVAGAEGYSHPVFEELKQFNNIDLLHHVRQAHLVEFTRAYAEQYVLEKPANENRFCLLNYTDKGYEVTWVSDEELKTVSRL